MEQEAIKCPECKSRWWITHWFGGYVVVRPGEFFTPTSTHWQAQCECRTVRRNTEAELYRAVGIY